MGRVWRAHDDLLHRDVAVKEVIFPPGLTTTERDVLYERTLREARSAARLSHRGIVTVHDVVEEDGRPWIVMEFVPARSLQDVIDQDGPLPARQVAEIGRQMLAALRAAHAAGVLHRDVKPANVLLDTRGADDTRVVITDFGIARVEGEATLTQTGMVLGSPAYIAPERARGEHASVASDLWALGATLYAACEGYAPHDRAEAVAVLAAVLTQDPNPPGKAGPLAPVVMGLLARDPDARLTAERAAEDLERAAGSLAAGPPGTGPATSGAPDGLTMLDPATMRLPEPRHLAGPESGVGSDQDSGAGTGQAQRDRPHLPAGRAYPAGGPIPGRGPYPEAGPAQANHPYPGAGPAAGNHPYPGPDRPPYVTDGQTASNPMHPPGENRRPSRRLLLPVTLAMLVVTAVTVGFMLRHTDHGAKPSPVQRPTGTPTGGPTTVPTRGQAGPSTPPGFQRITGPDGATFAIPSGWTRQVMGDASIRWTDPSTGAQVQVDSIPWGVSDPVQHWKSLSQEIKDKHRLPGYRPQRFGDRYTYRGWVGADFEYTWTSTDYGTMRGFDRGFTANGHQYAVLVAAPASRWSSYSGLPAQLLASFDPAP
jgi:hypothetical protein